MPRTIATALTCLALVCLVPLPVLAHLPAGAAVRPMRQGRTDTTKQTMLTIRLDVAGHPPGTKWKVAKESRTLGMPIHDHGYVDNHTRQAFAIETKDLAPGSYRVKFVGKVLGTKIQFVHQLAFDKDR